jgi:hypothetical protein
MPSFDWHSAVRDGKQKGMDKNLKACDIKRPNRHRPYSRCEDLPDILKAGSRKKEPRESLQFVKNRIKRKRPSKSQSF